MPRLMQRTWHRSIGTGTLGLAVASLLMISRPAAASIEYPGLVKNYWDVKKLPVTGADGCALCHTTDPGMLGTANQKFALTLKGFGLQAKSDHALQAALDKNQSKMSDSDGDGFSDYEEIALDGTNPNDPKDHAAAMTTETAGSGTGGAQGSNDPGATLEAGASPDAIDAGGADPGTDEVPPQESLGQCTTTTEQIYPTLSHGCSLGAGSAGSPTALLASALAACLIRRGVRAGKGRREKRGKQP